jgi:hypothetical protein
VWIPPSRRDSECTFDVNRGRVARKSTVPPSRRVVASTSDCVRLSGGSRGLQPPETERISRAFRPGSLHPISERLNHPPPIEPPATPHPVAPLHRCNLRWGVSLTPGKLRTSSANTANSASSARLRQVRTWVN